MSNGFEKVLHWPGCFEYKHPLGSEIVSIIEDSGTDTSFHTTCNSLPQPLEYGTKVLSLPFLCRKP
jgi:hypothetical protein